MCPRLVVEGADQAIAYYTQTLGAKEIKRFKYDDKIVHSELELGDYILMVKDASEGDPGPDHLGGSPVLISLEIDDVDAVGKRMIDGGATVVYPIGDQEYGKRAGRLRDPYGHLWIVSESTADLEP